MVTPFSLPISAVRFSHSTASNGAVLPSVKYRLNTRPVLSPEVCSGLTPVCSDLPFNAVLTVAMYSPRSRAPPRGGGHPYYTPPHFRGGAARSPNGGNLTRWLVGFQSKKFRPRLAVEIVENECKTQRPAAGRCCCYHTAFTAALLRFACGHEAGVRARLVCLGPGSSRGRRTRIISSTRSGWRFHVPPNLESQYRRARKSCQEKNAKCGYRTKKLFYL